MAVQERFYNADDLWVLSHDPHYSETRLELSEGILIEMSLSGGKHGGLTSKFARLIGGFVENHDLGFTVGAGTGFILSKNPDNRDTVRAPDVGYIAAHRLPNGVPDGFAPLAPDLAVEVVSPTDSADDIQSKLRDYLKYGVRMIVYVYPKSQTLNVHTPQGTQILTTDDRFDGGDVLPGFSIAVADIFK